MAKKELSRIALMAQDRSLSPAGEAAYDEAQAIRDQMARQRHYNHVCNAFDQAIAKHNGEIVVGYSNWHAEVSGTVYRNGHYYWRESRQRAYHSAIIKIETKGGEVLWLS
jgi:hypothetical protein